MGEDLEPRAVAQHQAKPAHVIGLYALDHRRIVFTLPEETLKAFVAPISYPPYPTESGHILHRIAARVVDIPGADQDLAGTRDPPSALDVQRVVPVLGWPTLGIRAEHPLTELKHLHVGRAVAPPQWLSHENTHRTLDPSLHLIHRHRRFAS